MTGWSASNVRIEPTGLQKSGRRGCFIAGGELLCRAVLIVPTCQADPSGDGEKKQHVPALGKPESGTLPISVQPDPRG